MRLKSIEKPEDIGLAFLDFVDLFKMYAIYCSNQARIIAIIEEARTSSAELKRLDERALDDPKTRNQGLRDILILPMQRVCRYPMFLDTLAKYVDGPSLELDVIKEALFRYKALVAQINEYTRRVENVSKLTELAKRLREEKTINLVDPKRHFVWEGRLKMRLPRSLGITSTSEVDLQDGARCMLFDDLLISCAPVEPSDPKSLLTVKFSLDLTYCFNVRVEDATDEHNKAGEKIGFEVAFQLYADGDSSKPVQKKFKFKALNGQDRDLWVKKFRELPVLIARRDVAELSTINRHLSGATSSPKSAKTSSKVSPGKTLNFDAASNANNGRDPAQSHLHLASSPPFTARSAGPASGGGALANLQLSAASPPQTLNARTASPASSVFTRGMNGKGLGASQGVSGSQSIAARSVRDVPRTISAPFKTKKMGVNSDSASRQGPESDENEENDKIEENSHVSQPNDAKSFDSSVTVSQTRENGYINSDGGNQSADSAASSYASSEPSFGGTHVISPRSATSYQLNHNNNNSNRPSMGANRWMTSGPPKAPLPVAPGISPRTQSTASSSAQANASLSDGDGEQRPIAGAQKQSSPRLVAEPSGSGSKHSSPTVSPSNVSRSPVAGAEPHAGSAAGMYRSSATSPRLFGHTGTNSSNLSHSPNSTTIGAKSTSNLSPRSMKRETENSDFLESAHGPTSSSQQRSQTQGSSNSSNVAAYGRFSGPGASSSGQTMNHQSTGRFSAGPGPGPGPLTIPIPTHAGSGPLSPTYSAGSGLSSPVLGFSIESPTLTPSPSGFATAWQQNMLRDFESVALGFVQALQMLKSGDAKMNASSELPLDRGELLDTLKMLEEQSKEELEDKEAVKKALAVVKRRLELQQSKPVAVGSEPSLYRPVSPINEASEENTPINSPLPADSSSMARNELTVNRMRAGTTVGVNPMRLSASLSNLEMLGDLLDTISSNTGTTRTHIASLISPRRPDEESRSDFSGDSSPREVPASRAALDGSITPDMKSSEMPYEDDCDDEGHSDDTRARLNAKKTPRKSVEHPDMYTQMRRQSDARRASFSRSISYAGPTANIVAKQAGNADSTQSSPPKRILRKESTHGNVNTYEMDFTASHQAGGKSYSPPKSSPMRQSPPRSTSGVSVTVSSESSPPRRQGGGTSQTHTGLSASYQSQSQHKSSMSAPVRSESPRKRGVSFTPESPSSTPKNGR